VYHATVPPPAAAAVLHSRLEAHFTVASAHTATLAAFAKVATLIAEMGFTAGGDGAAYRAGLVHLRLPQRIALALLYDAERRAWRVHGWQWLLRAVTPAGDTAVVPQAAQFIEAEVRSAITTRGLLHALRVVKAAAAGLVLELVSEGAVSLCAVDSTTYPSCSVVRTGHPFVKVVCAGGNRSFVVSIDDNYEPTVVFENRVTGARTAPEALLQIAGDASQEALRIDVAYIAALPRFERT
jgi:hypothetical protein